MANEEIQKYIKECREKNFSDDVIRNELLKVGWPEADITEAFGFQLDSVFLQSSRPRDIIIKETAGQEEARIPSKKWLKALIIAIVAFFILSGAAAGYYFLVKNKKSDIPQAEKNHEEVISEEITTEKLPRKKPFEALEKMNTRYGYDKSLELIKNSQQPVLVNTSFIDIPENLPSDPYFEKLKRVIAYYFFYDKKIIITGYDYTNGTVDLLESTDTNDPSYKPESVPESIIDRGFEGALQLLAADQAYISYKNKFPDVFSQEKSAEIFKNEKRGWEWRITYSDPNNIADPSIRRVSIFSVNVDQNRVEVVRSSNFEVDKQKNYVFSGTLGPEGGKIEVIDPAHILIGTSVTASKDTFKSPINISIAPVEQLPKMEGCTVYRGIKVFSNKNITIDNPLGLFLMIPFEAERKENELHLVYSYRFSRGQWSEDSRDEVIPMPSPGPDIYVGSIYNISNDLAYFPVVCDPMKMPIDPEETERIE